MSFLEEAMSLVSEVTQEHPGAPSSQTFQVAAKHAGADPSTFQQALGNFDSNSVQGPPAEHEVKHMQNAHDEIYGQNGGVPTESHTPSQLGSAAALQAFQSFQSGSGGGGGGGGVQDLIGMAMGEGMKLFSAQGGSGDQSEILKQATKMAMKLYMGHQGSQGGGSMGAMSMLKMFT